MWVARAILFFVFILEASFPSNIDYGDPLIGYELKFGKDGTKDKKQLDENDYSECDIRVQHHKTNSRVNGIYERVLNTKSDDGRPVFYCPTNAFYLVHFTRGQSFGWVICPEIKATRHLLSHTAHTGQHPLEAARAKWYAAGTGKWEDDDTISFTCDRNPNLEEIKVEFCDAEISLSQRNEVNGLYRLQTSVVSSGARVYKSTTENLFLYKKSSSWMIGTSVGAAKRIQARVKDSAVDVFDVSAKWTIAKKGKLVEDPDLAVRCSELEREDVKSVIPKGYELKQGSLGVDCHLKTADMDVHTAISHCTMLKDCLGFFYESVRPKLNETHRVFFKSCVVFNNVQGWTSVIKSGDVAPLSDISFTFINSCGKDLVIYKWSINSKSGGSEPVKALPNQMNVTLEVAVGAQYFGKTIFGEFLANVTIGMSKDQYTFDEALSLEYQEKKFKEEYKNRTGRKWLSTYPHDPLVTPILPPKSIGSITEKKSTHHFWYQTDNVCPVTEDSRWPTLDGDSSKEPLTFKIETLSTSPKVFLLHDVLSSDEVDHILNITKGHFKTSATMPGINAPKHKKTVVSKHRTSSTAWIEPWKDDVVLNIFYRIADILDLNHARVGKKFGESSNTEMLQAIRYEVDQEYKVHADYFLPFVATNKGYIQSGHNRVLTVLFYLQPADEGGGTRFPKAESGNLEVRAERGSAVFFYNLLEDANVDINTMHAGLPVKKGVKIAANMWIWDPMYGLDSNA